ncbi:MAG: GDSL-type esterase/lipase family protein [Thermoanaerobaculia bacterium]
MRTPLPATALAALVAAGLGAVLLPAPRIDAGGAPRPAGVTVAPKGEGVERYRDENARLGPPSCDEGRVVFFGDSITEGWIHALPELFAGRPWVDRGIGGETTARMLARFRQDVLSLEPEVLVLLAGTNDVACNDGPTTPETTLANLAAMVELARGSGIRVVLATLPPALDFPWRPGLVPAPQIVSLNARIREYARRERIVLVDYHAAMADAAGGMRAGLSEDGVHPNRAGYEVMAPLAEAAIREARRLAE